GQLLERGVLAAGAVLVVGVLGIGVWALRVTHRIVAPVHTLRRALDAMVTGDLGVRIELHEGDEFHDGAAGLNRLVEESAAALAGVPGLADRTAAAAETAAHDAGDASAERRLHSLALELDQTLEFFRLQPRRTIRENDSTAPEPAPR